MSIKNKEWVDQEDIKEENEAILNDEENKVMKKKIKAKNVIEQNSIQIGPRTSQIIVNIFNTEYDIIRTVMEKNFNYIVTEEEISEYDLCWADTALTIEKYIAMKSYQKINHFPGMSCIARKNNLGRNLMRLNKLFPDDYNFFPKTWLLPLDTLEFKNQFNKNKLQTFILKPEAMSQGKGIFLTRSYENIDPNAHYVAQRYINKPYLIEGLKFDLRVYVLVYGCDPLRIFIYKEGLARLATEQYTPPQNNNLENLYIHLTNYAINKNSSNFIFNNDENRTDVGHKRSLSFVWKYIQEKGGDVITLQNKIKDAIIKTLCAVQPILADTNKSCLPYDDGNDQTFEILGFDVLLDRKLKPWILEVNHSPSFTTDTPFDVKIKSDLISDTVKLINLNHVKRKNYYIRQKKKLKQRMEGKKIEKISKEMKSQLRDESMAKRDKYEEKNLGGFTRIYPVEGYEKYLQASHNIWEEFFGGKKILPPKPNKVNEKRMIFSLMDNPKKQISNNSPSKQQQIKNGPINKFSISQKNLEKKEIFVKNDGLPTINPRNQEKQEMTIAIQRYNQINSPTSKINEEYSDLICNFKNYRGNYEESEEKKQQDILIVPSTYNTIRNHNMIDVLHTEDKNIEEKKDGIQISQSYKILNHPLEIFRINNKILFRKNERNLKHSFERKMSGENKILIEKPKNEYNFQRKKDR